MVVSVSWRRATMYSFVLCSLIVITVLLLLEIWTAPSAVVCLVALMWPPLIALFSLTVGLGMHKVMRVNFSDDSVSWYEELPIPSRQVRDCDISTVISMFGFYAFVFERRSRCPRGLPPKVLVDRKTRSQLASFLEERLEPDHPLLASWLGRR